MKKKNKLLNVLMIMMIMLIALSATIAAGSIKGWFTQNEDNARAEEIIGLASIERSGIAYTISNQTDLQDGDTLSTRAGSTLNIEAGKNILTLGEKTEIEIKTASKETLEVEIKAGEIFAQIDEGENVTLSYDGKSINTQAGIYTLNLQTGSSGINIFSGEVEVTHGSTTKQAKSGETIIVAGDNIEVKALKATSLNQFNIDNIKKANKTQELCITNEEIDQVIQARAEEKQKAQEEQETHNAEIIAKGGTQEVENTNKATLAGTSTGGSKSNKDSNKQLGSKSNSEKKQTNALSCTISIRCDTILDNMGDLREGKNKYVPSNGVILSTSKVEFTQGETVFDILKRTCSAAGIQLEYSYTPMYSSYYIEGINHLYEFDCGNQSGWMYKVNGWFPNYGCSVYEIEDGDTIVWTYTCKGLGKDVGGGVY